MATSLDLQRLNDEASDWFYRHAEVTTRIKRGPDLQWCLDRDGNFQIWTTEQLTPGRTILPSRVVARRRCFAEHLVL